MPHYCDDCDATGVPLRVIEIGGSIGLALCLDCALDRGIEYNEWKGARAVE